MDSDPGYRVIQFTEPTSEKYRENLAEKGLEFIQYIPENAWVVKGSARRNELVSEKKVRYLGDYRPDYKIGSDVRERLRKGGNIGVRVRFFSRPENETLEDIGVEVSDIEGLELGLRANSSRVREFAEIDEVREISLERPELETFNDLSRQLIDADGLQETPYDLTGEGFRGAVWDQGLAGEHRDLNYSGKRIVGDSGVDVLGHATHVAGTMLGGGKEDSSLRGIAPDAGFVTYRWPDGSDFIQELKTEAQDSADHGSVVSQNSWGYGVDGGCDLMGGYFEASKAYDNITHGIEGKDKMLFVFSAGNQRAEESCGGLGYTYNTTTGPGATAKNTLSVGAVDDFGAMTAYSSWGPTDDGRIKPEVVADGGCGSGTGVKSTLPGNEYGSKCGTSMASPAVSGAVILMNQQFNRTYNRLPEPATAKGLIVHNAEDLDTTGPDYRTGYGLVNATKTIDYVKKSRRQGLIQKGSVQVDETNKYSINVSPDGSARFTLVWSDYPGTSNSGKALVNDLDLKVSNSSGHRFYPWTLNWSERKGSADRDRQDRKNNVVQVYIPNLSSEKINVSVHGQAVPHGPQQYSLMMTEKKRLVPEIDVETPQNRSYSRSPDFNFSTDKALNDAKFSVDNTANKTMANTSERHFYNTTTELEEGKHNATFYALNQAWTNRTEYFTVDKTAPELTPLTPLEDANLSGLESIEASWNDSLSRIASSEYIISNETGPQLTGGLNSTVNTSDIEDGEYNLTYRVEDTAGNSKNTTFNITVDNTMPELTEYSPEKKAVRNSFSINASWEDKGTGLENAYYRFENSTDSWEGSFNDSIDFSSYENGNYTLKFVLEDYAGNRKVKNTSLSLDDQKPSINITEPLNGTFISQEFDVEASINDNISGIESGNFTLENGTELLNGSLNGSVSDQGLAEGKYNITFKAKDFAGNTVEKRINVTLDSERPQLSFQSPETDELITGNFSVNASAYDNFSGLEEETFSIENESGKQITGKYNRTINSTQLADGNYSISVKASDKAGNTAEIAREIFIDNRPPVLRSSTVKQGGNISGDIDIGAEFEDVSEIKNSSFRLYNSSGNITSWEGLEYSNFNTSGLEDGVYAFEFRAEDASGFSKSYNVTEVLVDNAEPEIQINSEGSEKYNGWIKDGETVDISCTDEASGVENISASSGSGTETINSSSGSFEADDSGNNSYSFRCMDYAGNSVIEERFYSIDSQKPEIEGLNPEQGSLTNLNFSLTVDFMDESSRSGIDTDESTISVQNSEGEVSSIRWTNDSVTAEITGLTPSTNFTVEGEVRDNVGHSQEIEASYSTLSTPQAVAQSIPATAGNSSQNESTPEEKFSETEKGLRIENLRIEEAENREINVSSYSEDTLSELKILGARKGLTDLTVESLETPDNISEGLVVNRFLSIEVENDSLVDSGSVRFNVEKAWMERENIDPESLQLYRVDGSWEGLETVMIGNYSDEYLFEVNLGGFSEFAVAGERLCTGPEVSAVSPDGSVCRSYVSSCKPDGWEQVQSCGRWSDRQEAQQALNELSNQNVSQEKIENVREEVEEGNYTGAVQMAEEINDVEETENSSNLLFSIFAAVLALLVIGALAYIAFRYYRRQKLVKEINRVGEELMNQTGEDKLNKYTTMTDKVIQAKKALQMNEYSRASQKIKQYNDEAQQRGLDVPEADVITQLKLFDDLRQRLNI